MDDEDGYPPGKPGSLKQHFLRFQVPQTEFGHSDILFFPKQVQRIHKLGERWEGKQSSRNVSPLPEMSAVHLEHLNLTVIPGFLDGSQTETIIVSYFSFR